MPENPYKSPELEGKRELVLRKGQIAFFISTFLGALVGVMAIAHLKGFRKDASALAAVPIAAVLAALASKTKVESSATHY